MGSESGSESESEPEPHFPPPRAGPPPGAPAPRLPFAAAAGGVPTAVPTGAPAPAPGSAAPAAVPSASATAFSARVFRDFAAAACCLASVRISSFSDWSDLPCAVFAYPRSAIRIPATLPVTVERRRID